MGRELVQKQQQSAVSYTVDQLVAVNPYNPDILPDLENYVNDQVLPSLSPHTIFVLFFWVVVVVVVVAVNSLCIFLLWFLS